MEQKATSVQIKNSEGSDTKSILDLITFINPTKNVKNLTRLNLNLMLTEESFFSKINPVMLNLRTHFPYLKSLDLKFIKDPDDISIDPFLIYPVLKYNALETLTIKMMQQQIVKLLVHYEAGESFFINGISLDESVDEDLLWFKDYPPVNQLLLRECHFLSEHCLLSYLFVCKNHLLRVQVELSISKLALLNILSCCMNVYCLYLGCGGASITYEDLRKLVSLTELCELCFNCLFDTETDELIRFFSHKEFKNIKSLSFGSCRALNDEVLFGISLACSNLDTLCINQGDYDISEVTDNGVWKILKNCNKLTKLSLINLCNVRGYFLSTINVLVPQLTHLEILDCSIESPFCKYIIHQYASRLN